MATTTTRRPRRAPTCPRTGLPTSQCECAIEYPDLTQPLSRSERQRFIDRARERERREEEERD